MASTGGKWHTLKGKRAGTRVFTRSGESTGTATKRMLNRKGK